MLIIIIVVVVLVILFKVLVSSAKQEQEASEYCLRNEGYNIAQYTPSGKYLAGHPDINEPIAKTDLYFRLASIDIFDSTTLTKRKVGSINKDCIKNVTIEDKTTIEKRVTVARLLLVGIFAFGWKKKKINELAYLVIEWNDSKFNHETIFEFEGNDAMAKANKSRNLLIQALS